MNRNTWTFKMSIPLNCVFIYKEYFDFLIDVLFDAY